MQRQNKGNNSNNNGSNPQKDKPDQKKENAPKPVQRPPPSLVQYDRRKLSWSSLHSLTGTKRTEPYSENCCIFHLWCFHCRFWLTTLAPTSTVSEKYYLKTYKIIYTLLRRIFLNCIIAYIPITLTEQSRTIWGAGAAVVTVNLVIAAYVVVAFREKDD